MEDDLNEVKDISDINLNEIDFDKEEASLNDGLNLKRRKKVKAVSSVDDSELIAQFLAKNKVKKCPPSYAEGALSKGFWEF